MSVLYRRGSCQMKDRLRTSMRLFVLFALLLVANSARANEVPAASERFASLGALETPDLRRHVLPLLGRLGCNGRACHGSFQGQGGFRLSLFGYDLKADREALLSGDEPRTNLAVATDSLILQKPTLAIDHEGGERMKQDSWQYRLLLRWIEGGARATPPDAPELSQLETTPSRLHFDRSGESTPLKVVAVWSDGTREDVTPLCRFRSNDESIAAIDENGLITSVHPGDTHVVAFYDNGVQPVEVITPITELARDEYPDVAAPTKIDQLVLAKIRELGLVPSEVCTDAEFLRRTNLDLTGTLPTPDEVVAFLADGDLNKRARKVEELLSRPTYAAWWTTHLCDYTGNNSQQLKEQPFQGDRASAQWYTWIYNRVQANVPYDEIAAGIILATSRKPDVSYDEYAAEMARQNLDNTCQMAAECETMPFYWMRRNNRKPEEMAQAFAHAFLGIRIQCAQCHKHPFDQWTKQDYDQFAAFFGRIRIGVAREDRKRFEEISAYFKAPDLQPVNFDKDLPRLLSENLPLPWRELFVESASNRPDKPSKDGKTPPPTLARFLDGDRVDIAQVSDPRQLLVDWLRKDADRYFARSFVNRVWANYFHRGIVDPPDDFNRANPPCNAPLLNYLTRGFIDHKFDIKWLHREIVLSRTYQLSCQPNETNALDTRNFSRAVPRRLPAEVAYNAITQATARSEDLAALQVDPNRLTTGSNFDPENRYKPGRATYALNVFGRPSRLTTCDCERSGEPTLLQTLYLQNDNEMLGTIERGDGWMKELIDGERRAAVSSQLASFTDRIRSCEGEQYTLAGQLSAAATEASPRSIDKLRERKRSLENELRGFRQQHARLNAELGKLPTSAAALDAAEIVRQAYLRTVSRPPSEGEQQKAVAYLQETPDRRVGIRDVLWALMNTKEFILNH